MGEELFVKLRDCFTAGYMFPQYCIDNGIKKPLFVSEKKHELFLWEINSQFKCDKRLLATFCFIDNDKTKRTIDYTEVNGEHWISGNITVTHISSIKLDEFDKIIFLTKDNFEISSTKIIRFADLEKFFVQQVIIDIPLLNFLQRYPRVKMILTNFPWFTRYKDGQEFNEQLLEYNDLVKIIKNSEGKHIETPFDKLNYTNAQVIELLKRATVKSHRDGSTIMLDDNSPLVRIQDGKRATAYQPKKFLNRIYFFGTCYQYGFQAPFDKTIESYLQKMLNENNLSYRVENEGQFCWNRFQDIFYNLNKLNPSPGDIIFINSGGKRSNSKSIPFCNVGDAFDPPHNYKEIFCTKRHVNELGYKLVAEKYFEFLTKNNFFRDVEFKYPPPVNLFIAMVYRRNSRRAA